MINISYPDYLLNSLRLSANDFEKEIKTSGIIKLFELGKISSGIAAKALGISRVEFLDKITEYKVSLFDLISEDLDTDIANA